MSSISAGIVIITVTAFTLPIKPQTYSLAVQACSPCGVLGKQSALDRQ